jgi:ribosomal protein S18 acetylase RimI-like enzyme
MDYRIINEDEFTSISIIHKYAFPDFFLTSLGIKFLNDYYKATLKNENTIAICSLDEHGIINGFAVGSLISKGYHKNLFIKNFGIFSYRAVILLFTKPLAILRLANNLDKRPNINDDGNYAELLSIGILPELKGSGIGNELLLNFEKEVIARGAKKLALTTDSENNDRVVSFYKKNGYEIFYSFITYPSRKMFKMIKDLANC